MPPPEGRLTEPAGVVDPGTRCIGVDGGATGFRLARVEFVPGHGLQTCSQVLRGDWPRDSNFVPLPIGEQQAQLADPRRSGVEQKLEGAWVQALARGVRELLAQGNDRGAGPGPLRLGIALPGRKDFQGRGVLLMARGPRLLNFCSLLESELNGEQEVAICPLGSDGQDGGLGEEWAGEGSFGGRQNAFYLGLGTGLAEAAKVDGTLLDVQGLARGGAPPWEALVPGESCSVEEAASLGSILQRLEEDRGPGLRPLDAARAGEPLALRLLERSARVLGAWLGQRIRAAGGEGAEPITRVVIGGSGAQLLKDPKLRFFRQHLGSALGSHELLPSRLETPALFGSAARALGLTGSRPF